MEAFKDIEPKYGEAYKAGYIGFTRRLNPGIVSRGIAYFTRWDRMSDIAPTHAFVVARNGVGIEAEIGRGVVEFKLDQYFDDPSVQVFFRKPRDLTAAITGRMVLAAYTHIGAKYDNGLIGAHAISGSFLGRLMSLATARKSEELIAGLLNDPDKWICSEYAAWCMKEAGYDGRGCLKYSEATITPVRLFGDDVVFEEWK